MEIMQGAPFERMEVGGTEQRGEVCYVCKCVWCSLCKCVCVCVWYLYTWDTFSDEEIIVFMTSVVC